MISSNEFKLSLGPGRRKFVGTLRIKLPVPSNGSSERQFRHLERTQHLCEL